MVLDEASPTSYEFASEPQSSESDPATPSSGAETKNALPPYISLASLPRPIPVFGPLLGYSDKSLARLILMDGNNFSSVSKRPLSQEEWEACAYHCAKLKSISSFAGPIGVMAGWLRADTTKAEFRFPFFKPDPQKFDFQKFPYTSLQGQAAASAWHWLRRLCYVGVSAPIAKALIGTYAMSVAIVGQSKDPRMKDLVESLKVAGAEKREARAAGLSRAMGQNQQQQQQLPQDGAGPQGNAWGRAQQSSSSMGASAASEPFAADYGSRSEQSAPFFDDASPTAGSEQLAPIGSARSSQNQTAWDRLREGKSPQPQPNQRSQSPPATGGDAWARVRGGSSDDSQLERRNGPGGSQDSYAFSAREEEGQLARSEAQRDFNARLERERHGENFSDDSKQRGGWRS